jgi:hypothetical protein
LLCSPYPLLLLLLPLPLLLLLLLVMLFLWPSCVYRYNFLLYVPYQLERIMIFGTLLCFYSFLVRKRTPICLWC